MKTSQAGRDMIKRYEGCKLAAYHLPNEKYWTIGVGHYGADVEPGMVISQERADELFRSDLERFEKAVEKTHLDLSQCQFDALVSFAYNCGVGNLNKLTRNRTQAEIAAKITAYNKGCGKVLPGLVKRRQEEQAMFKAGIKSDHEIAVEVIDGLWGAGVDRKNRLTAAGHSYGNVQKEVNRILVDDRK